MVCWTAQYIRRAIHCPGRQLGQAIHRHLEFNKVNSKPFSWAKFADGILASIERSCL